jgi:hypothetical protein
MGKGLSHTNRIGMLMSKVAGQTFKDTNPIIRAIKATGTESDF